MSKQEAIEGELIPSDVGGAPTKYTPATVNKLIAAFNNAFSVNEACSYASITKTTYYNWAELHPGFFDRMKDAQMAPNKKAKEIVMGAIQAGDANMAFKYLQARDPDFKAKSEMEVRPGVKTEEKLKEFMDDTDDNAYPNAIDVESAESSTAIESDGGDKVAQSTPDIS